MTRTTEYHLWLCPLPSRYNPFSAFIPVPPDVAFHLDASKLASIILTLSQRN